MFSMASTSALKDLCRAAIVASDIDKLKAVLNDNRGILFLNSVERDEKLTCLMIAALEGSLAVCKLLVESKCDPNVQNNVRFCISFLIICHLIVVLYYFRCLLLFVVGRFHRMDNRP